MKHRLGGPAFVLALVALFVALGEGAVAAGIVPVARHAITADTASNALRLGGKTPAQISKSLRGARGADGPQGPAGPQGEAGPKGSQGAGGPQGATGPQGPKGDVGAGLKIVGTVATVGQLPTAGTTGDAYLVTGNLHVWTGSGWTDAGPVQGPKGDPGAQGPAGPAGPAGAPGSASVSVHSTTFSFTASGTNGDQGQITASCGSAQKAVSGGYSTNGVVVALDTHPTAADDGWQIYLGNADKSAGVTGTVYAVCVG